jgi:3-oxoacyl-[acyl-carrier-protein] synthase II
VSGRSGIGPITTFPAEHYRVRIAGLVKDFHLQDYLPGRSYDRYLSRGAAFGVAAFLQAMAGARVTPDTYEPWERGVSIGCGVKWPEPQHLSDMLDLMRRTEGRELPRHAPLDVLVRSHNAGMSVMALLGHCQGPMISVSTACASSAHAIGEAFRRIQDGEARLMAAGGYDAMTSYVDVLGFNLLGALTTEHNDTPERASRPFDRERSGFVLGEGAVVFVLEEYESAVARGAAILAEVLGYGSSMNAYRITDSPPDGGGAILAMANALSESGLEAGQIDYVVAHGTSTPGNDLSETVAIKEVFGQNASRLAVSSPKSMTGHLTAGAGALNLLAAVYALRTQTVPPTINYEHPDPKLDLDYVPNKSRSMPVRAAMVNAFAFGGTNAVLVVGQVGEKEGER